jgi:hypothetical protein
MLRILVRVKILTDALASVASVWIRPCIQDHSKLAFAIWGFNDAIVVVICLLSDGNEIQTI